MDIKYILKLNNFFKHESLFKRMKLIWQTYKVSCDLAKYKTMSIKEAIDKIFWRDKNK